MHLHVVDVVGNMVVLPARPWVKSTGSATQKITLRRCEDERKRLPVARTSKICILLMLMLICILSDSSDTEYFVGTGWFKTIEVEGVKVNFRLDTGAK